MQHPHDSARRTTVVVVANGVAPIPTLPDPRSIAAVIAADGGLARVLASGRSPDFVIGDLDSADSDVIRTFSDSGGIVERFPTDKDATDLELALDAAAVRYPHADLIVVGGDGDRFDHLLGEVALVAHRARAFGSVTLHYPPAVIRVLCGPGDLTVPGSLHSVISLIPTGCDAVGVTSSGVRWPLEGATLPLGTTRGVSNEFVASTAHIALTSGTLLVVTPQENP